MLHLQETTFIPDQSFPIHIFFTKDIPVHWHDHMEWMFIRRGKALIQVDDKFSELKSGELAMVGPKQLHSAKVLEGSTEIVAIVFNEALIRNHHLDHTETLFFNPYLERALKLPYFFKQQQMIEKMGQSIECMIQEYEEQAKGFELMIKSEIFKVFGIVFRHYYQFDDDRTERHQKDYHLSELLDYLRTHYDQKVSLAQAAQLANVSPNHLCKIFKKITGKTLTTYVHHLRVNEGERLLDKTDQTIAYIAEKVGFSNVTYFGRVFKKIKGMSPSEKRAQLQAIEHHSKV